VLDALGGLVDKSLIEADLVPGTRYRLLETVRAYGLEQLEEAGETSATQAAHAAYFLDVAETSDPPLRTSDQLTHLEILAAENDNLTAALRWAIDDGRAETANRLAAGLMWYWFLRGNHTESFGLMREVANVPGKVPDHHRAITLTFSALAEEIDGNHESSARALASALECLRRVPDRSRHPVLSMLEPIVAVFTDNATAARTELTKALELPDRWNQALAMVFRSHVMENAGDIEAAEADAVAAFAMFRSLGERWGISAALRTLANHRSLDGDHAGAVEAYEEAIVHLRELGSIDDLHELGSQLGIERWRAGDREGGAAELAAVLQSAERTGQSTAAMWVRMGLAEIAADAGDLVGAHAHISRALEDLTAVNFGTKQAKAYLLTMQGLLFVLDGSAGLARSRLEHAVSLALSVNDIPALAAGVQCTAGLALLEGDPARAASLIGLSTVLRGRPIRGMSQLVAIADRTRAALGDAAYDNALARSGALTRDEALARIASSRL
jgi:tetratricopeptide (TPR) repeat protein